VSGNSNKVILNTLTYFIHCASRLITWPSIVLWFIPNRLNVFGTGITLPGHSDVSQAASGPYCLQLCAALASSGIKISESHSALLDKKLYIQLISFQIRTDHLTFTFVCFPFTYIRLRQ